MDLNGRLQSRGLGSIATIGSHEFDKIVKMPLESTSPECLALLLILR